MYKMHREPNVYVKFYGIYCYAYTEGDSFELIGQTWATQRLLTLYAICIGSMINLSSTFLYILGLDHDPAFQLKIYKKKGEDERNR